MHVKPVLAKAPLRGKQPIKSVSSYRLAVGLSSISSQIGFPDHRRDIPVGKFRFE